MILLTTFTVDIENQYYYYSVQVHLMWVHQAKHCGPTGSDIVDHSVSTVDLVWHCCVAGMTCVRGLIEDSLGRRRNTCLLGKERNTNKCLLGKEKKHKYMFAVESNSCTCSVRAKSTFLVAPPYLMVATLV